jgi:4-amino-4-deoxy-L-arabinose transferase-like glycosyltransferase
VWILAFATLAFVLRVALGLVAGLSTIYDASEYLRLGHNLGAGNGFSFASTAPFVPTDYRLPGYPVVVAIADLFGSGRTSLLLFNAALGALTVVAVGLISQSLLKSPAARIASTLVAAVYPALVTYSAVAYSENLSICAECWLVYVAFCCPVKRKAWWGWVLSVGIIAAVVSLTRAEGAFLSLLGVTLALRIRRTPLLYTCVAIVLVVLVPLAWAIRNEATVGRFELTDPIMRDQTLLLSVNNGQFTPLYINELKAARDQPALHDSLPSSRASAGQRAKYHEQVASFISRQLSTRPFGVAAYKAKSLINLPFVPFAWQWSTTSDYSLSDSLRHPNVRNAIRIIWSVVLLAQYIFAGIGLRVWWRQRRYRSLVTILLCPVLAFLLAVPFHADLRLWYAPALLLVIPAVEGITACASDRRVRRGQRPGAAEPASELIKLAPF